MKLALLRHGRAADRLTWQQDDRERPLTALGRQRCRELFPHYARFTPVDMMWTSPLLRATQTADIAADIWQVEAQRSELLAIDQAPAACLSLIKGLVTGLATGTESVMMIGHNPHLSDLTALLCGWQHGADRHPFNLRKAGMICLSGQPTLGGMAVTGCFAPRHFLKQDEHPHVL